MPTSTPGLKSSDALSALTRYLASRDINTLKRGESYARGRRVLDIWEDDGVITGTIQGTEREPYTSTLHWNGARWSAECTCPLEIDCKHAYALGRTWLNRQSARPTPGQVTITRITGKTKAEAAALADKPTFRQEWSAKLAEKLGRPVNSDEGRLLGRLAALFSDLQAHGRLMPANVRAREFEVSHDAAPSEWEPVFPGWWSPAQPPADPWALWQYLAFDYQRAGREIPEILAVMTDTTAVRASAESRLVQQELKQWRHALGSTDTLAHHVSHHEADTFVMPADLRVFLQNDGKARLEVQAEAGKAWKAPTQKWLGQLTAAGLASFDVLPPATRALALLLRLENRSHDLRYQRVLACDLLSRILAHPAALPAVVLPDGTPFHVEPEPLRYQAVTDPEDSARLNVALVRPDGTPVPNELRPFLSERDVLYLLDRRVWRGPVRLPARLPVAALSDPVLASALRNVGMTLPSEVAAKFRTVSLRPLLRCWLKEHANEYGLTTTSFHAQLFATANEPLCRQYWSGFGGWHWAKDGAPAAPSPQDPHYTFDLSAANAVGARFGAFNLSYSEWDASWSRHAPRSFPEDFLAWRASLPPDTAIEVSPELQGLVGGPLRARLSVNLSPAEASGQDWFDLAVQLQPEDTTLTPAEIELLVKARGGWVKLPQRGWQRLAVDDALTAEERAALDRLGLTVDGEALSGRRTSHRYHALQLDDALIDDEVLADRLRARSAELRALPAPPLPDGLRAELRPYQLEGYHFLTHLAGQGLGGVLADDMGLGKTLQTLAWLLWLAGRAAAEGRPFRALVVAPKSVVPNWALEAARFAPALTTGRAVPGDDLPDATQLLVVNYVQLRLRSPELSAIEWDAVVLDEGQNIKNPASATARSARELKARHRLVLTGTPIENRLLDLWSLVAFAQPGLLGSQASFQRLYNDKEDPVDARNRLATRVRPFLLRRTKGQVARDLPARIEEEISCELDGVQRALYEAELKRARQLLLKVGDNRQFDAQRFNILQSLLRLRQICCDPRLLGLTVGDSGVTPTAKKRGRPIKKIAAANGAPDAELTEVNLDDEDAPTRPSSAKLEAMLDTVEPLVAEGHRVLIFSQFVSMLELIRAELAERKIGHLLLTGQTENRQALVDKFQAADGPPVFLLSLKAAGSGLNLTAASYVILYDPWWNPAVEAQAIDRTHRIGQKNTVMAYRLIAKDTVEEKIRALQREKSELASAVVQEESLATVMDLDSLRRILG